MKLLPFLTIVQKMEIVIVMYIFFKRFSIQRISDRIQCLMIMWKSDSSALMLRGAWSQSPPAPHVYIHVAEARLTLRSQARECASPPRRFFVDHVDIPLKRPP